MGNSVTSRFYSPPDDYEMIAEWWIAHGHPVLPSHLLSPLGVISSKEGVDQAAVFIYFDRNVPVCFLERVITRPGLQLEDAREAIKEAFDAAQFFATEFGCQLMCLRAPAAIARYAVKHGFVVDEREIMNMSCALQEGMECLGPQQ